MAQKYRGKRGYIPVRPPQDLADSYQQRADAMGIPLSSWVVLRLAEADSAPVPPFVLDDIERGRAKLLALAQEQQLDLEEGSLPMARSA